MRLKPLVIIAALLPAAHGAHAAEYNVGLVVPRSENAAILGEQARAGAAAAARATDADIGLETIDETCTQEGGESAARALIEREVELVIGFFCTESLEAAMPSLTEAEIPVITVGVRTESITDLKDRTGWPVFRLAPRADSERTAVADIITERWRTELFAIVDDGTIYGRELAENLRFVAEENGLSPVFVDTFRPQLDNQIALVGRLRRAGATHVFVGGDRRDIAIIARDAAELEIPLTVAGGEALRDAPDDVALREGILMIGLPRWKNVSRTGIVQDLIRSGIEPDGYVLPAYAAFQIAATVLAEAEAGAEDLAGIIGSREFSTAIGPIAFDERGDLFTNPYRLFVYDGEQFVPAE